MRCARRSMITMPIPAPIMRSWRSSSRSAICGASRPIRSRKSAIRGCWCAPKTTGRERTAGSWISAADLRSGRATARISRTGEDGKVKRHSRSKSGFTLMELLLVLVIIGLLAALVGPTLYQRIKPAREAAARAQIENFATALDGYYIDTGRYPSTQDGLKALRNKPEGAEKWNGPYLKKELPSDPWGNAYVYRAPGRNGGDENASFCAGGRAGGGGGKRGHNQWGSAQGNN